MNAADYIHFAGKIAAAYSEPASCRSAISRAYCGAFHLAKSFLDRIGSRPPRNANAHVFVQRRLMSCGHPRAEEAGSLLGDLYTDRLNADYNLDKSQVESVEYGRMRVMTAARIQDLLESCDNDEARRQIRTGIADYERRLSGS